jgi:hypothetical protein
MTDAEFARAFERGAIAPADFHHRSHLRLAWVYLAEAGSLADATARMAAALRRFAASAGHPEKYSDAVTAFWMAEMAAARAATPGVPFDALVGAHPRLLDARLPHAGDVG